jgi:hypothetical protein
MGSIESAGRLLQLVIHDPWFAWLHPMTELVVQIDELVTAREPVTPGAAEALLEQAKQMFQPVEGEGDEFQDHYHEAMQQAPAVVLAHAEALRRLAGPA